jgi:hypothetical protein
VQEQSLGPERPRTEDTVPPSTAERAGPWLPVAGLLIGLWASIPPYVGAFGELDVASRVEFADHVVPGVVVLAVAAVGYVLLRAPDPSQLLLFVGGATITLAGFWMMATHMPLLSQARNGQVPWGAVLWHSLPGVGVTLLGVVWTIRFWETDETDEDSGR